jgi:hypothetical protein
MKLVDLVILNGDIITVDKSDHRAEAVAVKDGKIVAVGKTKGRNILSAAKLLF